MEDFPKAKKKRRMEGITVLQMGWTQRKGFLRRLEDKPPYLPLGIRKGS